MKPGTKVQARRDASINPHIRGRVGVVKGPGEHEGTVSVVFDHATASVDPGVLDVIPEPEPNVGTE